MRPFHPPRPGAAQSHHPRPGDPGQPPPHALPMHHQQMNPAAFPGFGAANPMAAVAAANPFLAMQLFGQAQQLQNLGYLAAAALQQHQHHHQQPQQQQNPFFPGGFPPNPSQFGPFPGPQAGFNAGGGGFRPGGAGLPGGPRPPLPMMGAAGNGANGGGIGVNGSPRPALNVDGKDRGSGGGVGQVNQTTNKSDGISHVASENGVRNNATDQKSRFNPGRDGKDGRHFGPSGGRARGDSRGGGQFTPSGGRGRGDSRGGGQFSPSGGRGRGDARSGEQFSASSGRGRGRHFNQGRGRGRNGWREGKSNFTSSDSPTSGGCHVDSPASEGGRKRPPIIYDKNEVKQWIQARKKNYPTSVNVNQKLCQSQLDEQKKDEEAQMRRRELKEVIAKQKELGLELPELPPGYLSDNEGQPREPQKESNWKTRQGGGRFGNRGRGRGQGRGHGRDNKRQRYDSREDSQSKRPREWNNNSRCHDGGAMVKSREPTLLQKLLSSDIKRDRHRLLHTFKFMALNNFFKDWPAKPLEFPSVKVNQIEIESDIADEDSDDDLPDAEMAKGCSLGLKENGDQPDLSSSDEEDGSEDDDECDDKGADAEITEKVSDEDSECDASEEGFSDFSA